MQVTILLMRTLVVGALRFTVDFVYRALLLPSLLVFFFWELYRFFLVTTVLTNSFRKIGLIGCAVSPFLSLDTRGREMRSKQKLPCCGSLLKPVRIHLMDLI